MKNIFYKGSAIAGILAGSLVVNGQNSGTAGGGSTTGAGVGGGRAGATAGANPSGGSLNRIGAAGINQPATSPPIGGASVIDQAPNTIGGSSIATQNQGAPQTIQPNAFGNIVQNGIVDAQAGIPFSSLPPGLQQSIQAQLGGSQVQTISRDDSANGSVFRITTARNGVPTEMRFGANGTFLGSTALPGTATSFFTPGSAILFDTLPSAVQTTIRGQAGGGRIGNIVPQGQGYVVTYDINGQPTTMLVGPDGKILRAGPTAVGTAPSSAVGSLAITNPALPPTTDYTRTSAIQLDDVPADIRAVLKKEVGNASIQFINREQRASGDVYLVGARTDDDYVQLTIDAEGHVIRDTRDVPVVTLGAPQKQPAEISAGIPFSRVPVAIRDAVNAHATASEVRSVNLVLDNGKTVYDVIYMRDGRRDRIIIGKDGNILRTERDVSAALDNGPAKSRLAIGDLPLPVRETIRRQTGNVLVKDVTAKRLGDQLVYSVRYETNGAPVELLVDSAGAMVIEENSWTANDPNTPRPAPIPQEGEVVRTLSAAPTIDASGRSAEVETRIFNSNHKNDEPDTAKSVSLGDVPLAVQNSAKKLAGAGVIESIKPTLGDDGVLYEVTLSNEGDRQILRLNKDGAIRRNNPSLKP